MEFSEVYDFESIGPAKARVLKVHSDAATRTLQEVSFPNKAGGFGYTTPSSSVTSSQFITWRSDGELLELMQSSLDESLCDWLKVCFSGSAIVNCCITSGPDVIECLVCTSNGGARLSFLTSFERPRFFGDAPDFYSFYQIKGLQPSLINTATAGVAPETGEVIFVYGLSSGSILVARAAHSVTEISDTFELHHTSMIKKLWSGITPFAKSESDPSAVVDLTLILTDRGDHVVASVCKDHRLRLWDLKHRDCLQVLELLNLLPDYSAYSSETGSLHSHLVPGTFHRISSYELHPGDSEPSCTGLLVYLSLAPTSSLGSMQSVLSSSGTCSASYWCWLQLDFSSVRHRERDCLRVLGVDRLSSPANPMYASNTAEYKWGQSGIEEFSVLNFVPTQLNDPPLWNDDENSVFHRRGSGNHSSVGKLHGVWWLAQQVTDQQANLDDRYALQWSCASPHSVSSSVIKNGTAVSPGLDLDNPIPRWRRQPPILHQLQENLLISTTEEGSSRLTVDDVDEFLDFIFSPGRFSWFAIASSLKSLRNAHQLPADDALAPFERMGELRLQVRRTLVDELFYNTEPNEYLTLLKTFHATAIDYHEYGLQPLGLFEVPYGSALLHPDQSTYLPYAPGLVIVRRWGFSVLRPLERYERLLWNQQSDQPLCIPLNPAPPTNVSSPESDLSKATAHLVTRTRLLLQNLCKQNLWHTWKSLLYGSISPFVDDLNAMWDPCKLAEMILNEMEEKFGSFEPVPFVDPLDWKRLVFSDSQTRTTELLAFERLTKILADCSTAHFGESAFAVDNGVFDRSLSGKLYEDALDNRRHLSRNRQASDPLWFGSAASPEPDSFFATAKPLPTRRFHRLGLRFLCLAFTEACELRLKFAFGLLVIAMRFHMNPSNVETTFSNLEDGCNSVTSASILVRLTKLVHSFRLLHWLGSTRMRSSPDAEKLISIREHLNILGLNTPIDSGTHSATDLLRSTSPHSMHLPGMTLLEQLCADWPWLQSSLSLDSVDSDLTSRPCMLRCTRMLNHMYTALSPTEHSGRGLVRIFRHLLVGGHTVHLLTLTKLIASTHSQESCDSDSFPITLWTWEGDYCLLFLCTGLAHLLLGNAELAEKDFVRASDSLKCHIQACLLHSTMDRSPFPDQGRSNNLQDLLIGLLFPGEFNYNKLFCVKDTQELSIDTICPNEVQVRFLMKVMPVLEAADCVSQVLNLSEFSLNLLANVQLTSEPMDASQPKCTDSNQPAQNYSRRLTSILANLHAFDDGTSEGFLCNPVPDEELVAGKSSQSGLYVRYADLEAALWTRMFKHHLSLGNYSNAHFLIRSNPDAARRRDCLRQLIATLCDRGESARLVDFHYGSAEQECVMILEARARATDVLPSYVALSKQEPISSVNPYYDVLYAFHIRRSNYRAAAMALFEHVHRLAEETSCPMSTLDGGGFRAGGARLLFGLQRQAANLAAAINALYIVQEEHQWLIRPGSINVEDDTYACWRRSIEEDGEERDSEEERGGLQLLVDDDWAFADPDEETGSLSAEEEVSIRRVGTEDFPMAELTRANDSSRLAQDKQILQLNDLLRLYTLIRARLRLVQVCWEQGMLRAGSSSPQETVQSLLSLALYDEAIKVTERFELDCTPVITAVATRCAELAQYASIAQASTHTGQANAPHNSGSLSDAPPLPGLSSISSSLSYEADLVVQSLHRLSESAVRKNTGEEVALSTWNLSINELYWRLLEVSLNRLDPPTPHSAVRRQTRRPLLNGGGGQLHLLACEHLLNSKPNQLHLPQWLVSHLSSPNFTTARPVGLLRLYMRFDRVEAAYLLAMQLLDAATSSFTETSAHGLQAPVKQKLQSQSTWLPHNLIVRLSEALHLLSSDFPACKIMHKNLTKNMTTYFGRLQLSCSKLVPTT